MSDLLLTIPDRLSGERLDRALASLLPDVSRSRLKSLIEGGLLSSSANLYEQKTYGATVTDPSTRVKPGQVFALTLPEAAAADPQPQDIPLTILFEDANLLVLDKPAGMVVHPAPGNPDGTLVNALLHHCGSTLTGIGGIARPGIVHRIDKETSGILVVAKTELAHLHLSAQFANHSIDRRYRAFVWGKPTPPADRIEGAIGRHPKDRKRMAIAATGKPAITHYSTLAQYGPSGAPLVTQILCRLETGRTHQIRVHLTSRGHPLLGDPVYGRPPKQKIDAGLTARNSAAILGRNRILAFIAAWERQALHAAGLAFTHPVTGHRLAFESPLPEDLANLEAFLE